MLVTHILDPGQGCSLFSFSHIRNTGQHFSLSLGLGVVRNNNGGYILDIFKCFLKKCHLHFMPKTPVTQPIGLNKYIVMFVWLILL